MTTRQLPHYWTPDQVRQILAAMPAGPGCSPCCCGGTQQSHGYPEYLAGAGTGHPKLKLRWDVHLSGDDDQLGLSP